MEVFLIRRGKLDIERNGILFAGRPDAPAMQKDDLFRDGKPQASTAGIGYAGLVQTIKLIEQ